MRNAINEAFECPPDSNTAQSIAYRPGSKSGRSNTAVRPSVEIRLSSSVGTSRFVTSLIAVSGGPRRRRRASAVSISTAALNVSVASVGAATSSAAFEGEDVSIPRCAAAGPVGSTASALTRTTSTGTCVSRKIRMWTIVRTGDVLAHTFRVCGRGSTQDQLIAATVVSDTNTYMAGVPTPARLHRERAVAALRRPVQQTVTQMFSHADAPLEAAEANPGDGGLFGPESVSWQVVGHTSAFVGGIRALIVQSAHPEVLAGVVDHSAYRRDPFGRLSRTANWVTATTFGSQRDIARAVAAVRGAHRTVTGVSPRGTAYAAFDPALAAFVHNVLTDSFLVAYQQFGPGLAPGDADRFVVEQQRVAELLHVTDCPSTADDLHAWITRHPEIGASVDLADTQAFLRRPPLAPLTLAGYSVLYHGAVATIPPTLRHLLGLRARPGAIRAARGLVGALRLTLGESPSRIEARRRVALVDTTPTYGASNG